MGDRKWKTCGSCNTKQPPSQFYACGHGRRRGVCKTCVEDQKRWVEFGVLPWDYWNAVYAFDGCCQICKEPPKYGERLCVDHDHETGYVRGLLCKACNLGIGYLKDRVDRMASAIIYLEEANEAQSRNR